MDFGADCPGGCTYVCRTLADLLFVTSSVTDRRTPTKIDMPLKNQPNTAVKAKFNLKRREKWSILILSIIGLCAALFWRPISRAVLTESLILAQKPAQTMVDELLNDAKNPTALLERLWLTEKIPHRVVAVTSLKEHALGRSALLGQMETLLFAAAMDGDLEVRDLALAALAAQPHPELLRLLTEQLGDVDPAARVLALTHLHKVGNPRLAPLLIPLLDDRCPLVAAQAAVCLRTWTGEDFGVRMSQVPRKFNDDPSEKPDPVAAEAFRQGVERWKNWWKLHQQDFPAAAVASQRMSLSWRLPTPDVSMEDLAGKPLRLSVLRGKVVLITLWDTVTTNYFLETPTLNELQQRNSNRLAVLGISLDITANERDCCAEDHDHAAHPKPNLTTIRAQVQQVADKNGIKYPVLIDPTGSVGWRFNADLLPSYILIDAEGYIRRRFTGGRNLAALEGMVNEVASQTAQK